MLNKQDSILVLIDVQEKLFPAMSDNERLLDNLGRLLDGMRTLEIPVIVTEQIPEKLGPTHPDLLAKLSGHVVVSKQIFSCCGEPGFLQTLDTLGHKQILLCGIETHVCVYQTARDLLAHGREVHIVTDAVSSRTPENKALGLQCMRDAGAATTGVEMALFELLRVATGETFKSILKIVK